MIVYEGFFIKNPIEGKLLKEIEYQHITTEIKPAKTHEYLYGKEAKFIVTGYGINSSVEAYQVSLVSAEDDRLLELYKSIVGTPHITVSISSTGKPVEAKILDYTNPVPSGIERTVITVFGGSNGSRPIYDNN